MDWKAIAQISQGVNRRRYRSVQPITLNGFPYGLNTNLPPNSLIPGEAAELTNFSIQKNGGLCTRPGLDFVEEFSGAPGYFIDVVYCSIGGTFRTILSSSVGGIYHYSSEVLTSIGLAEGAATLLPYNDTCLVLDGSNIKVIENVASLDIAYDDGTGTTGYQINNINGEEDGTVDLGDGTNTRVAEKFTSQAWDSGYTIPPTAATFKLSRHGNGYTGTDDVDIVVRLRLASNGASLAEKTLVEAPIATNLSTDPTEYSVDFSSSDISTEMAPNTEYYLSVEYNNGDASNCVNVYVSDVAPTTGTDSGAYVYTGSWAATSPASYCIASLKPGMPPKGSFGAIYNRRPFVAGDPDNPGYVWFGNLTYKDWSTSNGGGYISAVDDDNTSYEVGGLQTLFNELFVFGTENEPYITRLTGSAVEDYALPNTYQKSWASKRSLAGTPNDIWVANKDGLFNFTGTQLYGDMRLSAIADPVLDRFRDYWSTSVVVEYFIDEAQIWVLFPNYHRILVCHIGLATRVGNTIRYPWSEYEFTQVEFSHTDYTWVESSTSNEYYLQYQNGDPSLDSDVLDGLLVKGVALTSGTVGSLSDGEWGFGDGDTLGYNTIYLRYKDEDPSSYDIRVPIIPNSLNYQNGVMYVSASNARLYRTNLASYLDNTSCKLRFNVKSPVIVPHVDACVIQRLAISAASKNGADFSLSIYAIETDQDDAALTLEYDLPAISGQWSVLETNRIVLQDWIEVLAYAFQFEFHSLVLDGAKTVIGGLEAYIQPLEM